MKGARKGVEETAGIDGEGTATKKTRPQPFFSSSLSPSQVGMDGLFLMSPDASRTLRKFPLSHIARWATPPSAGGAALVLYTRTPVDVEEVTLTLSGAPPTIRAVLDTLTCCCMQMVELLESEREASAANAESNGGAPPSSSSRRRHSSGGFRRRRAPPALPAAEDVEFWHSPEKQGWLQSQGDHIKTWRRRWHVLKQGYLFRFASESDASAGPNSRPRGVVDLSKITDVSGSSSGGGSTTSATMIRLSTPQGASIAYLADSETEAVEWMSALESSVARIVRAVAGFDGEGDGDDDDNGRRPSSSRSNARGTDTGSGRPSRPQAQQQQQPSASFDAANSAAAGLAAAGGNPFVSVVGYGSVLSGSAAAASPSPPSYPSHQHQQHQQHYAPTAPVYGDGGAGGNGAGYDRGGGGEMAGGVVFGGGPTFGGVAGVAGFAPAAAPSPYAGGGGYPAVSDPYAAVAAAVSAPFYAPYQPAQQQPPQQPLPPQAPPAAAPPALPEPWQVLYTSDGRAYFYNSATNATQWEPPQAASLV